MINITDIAGLIAAAITIAASATLFPWLTRLAKPRLAIVFVALLVLSFVPIAGTAPAVYLRGMIGELSITTLVLLLSAILRSLRGWPAIDTRSNLVLQGTIVLTALALYPLALGIGLFDPYRLGFGDPWFLAALALVALVAWFERLYLMTLCVALAVLGWAVGWYESDNLWDYLLDPLISIYAAGALIVPGAKWLRQRYRDRRRLET